MSNVSYWKYELFTTQIPPTLCRRGGQTTRQTGPRHLPRLASTRQWGAPPTEIGVHQTAVLGAVPEGAAQTAAVGVRPVQRVAAVGGGGGRPAGTQQRHQVPAAAAQRSQLQTAVRGHQQAGCRLRLAHRAAATGAQDRVGNVRLRAQSTDRHVGVNTGTVDVRRQRTVPNK